MGLLIANFHQFLTKLSAHNKSDFSFLDNNLSKYQGIFTKLGLCIDIVEVWFGIANGQISSVFDRVICPRHIHIFISGQSINLSKSQQIFTELEVCIDIVETWFGIAFGYISQFLTELSPQGTIMVGYYCFTLLFSYVHVLSLVV